ncbi:hypothetical protein SAXI111661_10110 [Saccharomonospora xinjiangensis]|uniref:hypothetical protein n=1 Tax=Saccharomonospora xinjiangensis TaxID=75294 RepID=UPI0010C57C8C|nr:hypothetical protein [Saccharomonospora xinjiangensis]QBQ59939.1 hypothetical protein EYD13_07890 [Saccharomonospora xinjiangensis]
MAESPASVLVEPRSSDPIPDLLENVIGISQYISVSYWVGQAIDLIFDVNPFEWIAQQLAGDWEKVQEAGVALEKLSEFNAVLSSVITSELETVSSDWEGNAFDSAGNYFSDLARTIEGQQGTLKAMGKEFEQTAIGMYETANSMKGFLEMLMDLLIAIGLELAAAAASSWTIIGPILSGAAAAATIGKALGVWDDLLQAHTIAWNAVQGLAGVTAGYLSTLGDIEKHTLPESNYDHPGA